MSAIDDSALADFYHREAEYLDDNELHNWLALLAPDVQYRVPVRAVRERGVTATDSDFTDRANFLWENIGTLRTRIRRLDSEFAWAERPPTRTRRLVTNIRRREPASGETGSETGALTNIAVYCYRGSSPTPVVLTGQRTDTLRLVDGELRLANRLVHLDSTVLGLHALSIFL
ncbi:aromatic-ring-hydroxylating dioxygenase subunit beta [Streptomyces radicis]|nr:aromatic-ring-hydroxylating dioxygenase subunit beta [Streptomyces radicis]